MERCTHVEFTAPRATPCCFHAAAPTPIYTLSLHDALPIWRRGMYFDETGLPFVAPSPNLRSLDALIRSEEHTSELQSRENLVCRLLLEKKNRGASCLTVLSVAGCIEGEEKYKMTAQSADGR